MSFADIKAELSNLDKDQLRELALKSWEAFMDKDKAFPGGNECSENDSELLAALEEAIAQAEAAPNAGMSGEEVHSRIREWISK